MSRERRCGNSLKSRGPFAASLRSGIPQGFRLPAALPEALAVSALDELDGVIAVAVNRGGLAFIVSGRRLRLGLPAIRPSANDASFGVDGDGAVWAFLAENRAFADGEAAMPLRRGSTPSSVPRAGEASYRRHPLAWEDDASAPGPPPTWLPWVAVSS
jgi:hypothetical protein